MQKRNLILLAIAVAVGLIAVLLANSWFSGMEERQESTVKRQETTRIVVASSQIEFGTRLTSLNVGTKDWPVSSVPQGAFVTTADALKNDRVALRSIVPGEPILASNVSGEIGRATLAALLLPGMRAASIPINDVKGVSGFVLPGTIVDVLLTRRIEGAGATSDDLRSDVILQNVHVLAIDQTASEKQDNPKVARTATLAVTLRDAQRLAIAEKLGGLSLVLRRLEDSADGTPTVSQLVTSRDLGVPRHAVAASRSAPVAVQTSYTASAGVVPPPIPAIGGATGIAPAPTGPSMTVVRGVEATSYPISQTRGR